MPDTTPHEPSETSRKTVESMSAYGIPQPDIAKVIGIDPKTLRKYYREELDTAETKANVRVAQSLYSKALGDGRGSVTAAIFWLKTRAGWKETVVNEHTGKDGGPIRTISSEMTPKEAAEAYAATLHSDEG